ncbi:MAG: S-layer homology domain-containing protein [Bacillota bacterium]|nr:S-layer homology domain-containing protein [Bacillota bacterium]
MRNLKKVLSLVLCMAVMLSVMVVGAGAAFKDQEKINNAEAVDACVALNIINGYTDGSYRPEGTITRAEACKMICVALNGGKEPVLGTNATASFTDTKGHWAEGYIESCVSQGIVAGVGGGKFNPNGNVTGSQFAKMLLIALGFKSDVENFTGNAWEVNTNVRATQKGLYDGLESMDVSAALSRDNAAQMVWNALEAYMVSYKNEFSTVNGQLVATQVLADKTGNNGQKVTLLKDKYNADIYEGVLTGSGNYNAAKNKLKMDVKAINGYSVSEYYDDSGRPVQGTWNDELLKYSEDVTGLLGQYVKVLVNAKGEVYGVFSVPSENTVVTATFSDVKKVSSDKVKIDGTEYKYDNGAVLKIVGKEDSTISALKETAYNSADTITFISNNGDNKFDVAYVNPIQSITKVTYVSKDSFTAGGEVKYEDVIAPTDLKKDDYVVKTTDLFTGDDMYVKADTVKGKITASKGAAGSLTDICVDGTWYQVAEKSNEAFSGMVKYASTGATLALKNTYTLQIVNGVVYNAKLESADSTDTALVLGASGAMDVDGNRQVKLLFADGTVKVVPAKDVYAAIGDNAVNAKKAFVTYEIKDGVYELTQVSDTNKLGKDSYFDVDAGFVKADKKINGTRIADSAVIYVQYKDGDDFKTEVMTGKELNAMGSNFGTHAYYVVDGSTICAALITGDGYLPGASAGKLYGYVTSEVTDNNNDGTAYKSFTVWTSNNESVDVKMKSTTASIAKDDIISFEMGADNFIEGVSEPVATTAAIKDFGAKYAIFYKNGDTGTNDYDFDDDVKFLYLNTKDVKGINGGELAKADGTGATNTYYANCKYVEENGKIVLIAIDTNLNKWDGASNIVNAIAAED